MTDKTTAPAETAVPAELSRPIRSLCWLSMFTEGVILALLPLALVMGVLEIATGGPQAGAVRLWAAFIIGIIPFHIVVVERLLRQPRRVAPPALRASQFFAAMFVGAMLIFTVVVVVWPVLEMLEMLALGEPVSSLQVVRALGIMVAYQIVLWMAWLATPQLDVAAGTHNLVWRPARRGKKSAPAQ